MNRSYSRIEQLRVPPQSVEAEQAVIGGIMLAPDAYDRIADRITESDFYRRDHQLIFRAIVELAKNKKPYDAVTLGEWFASQGLSEMVANGAYLIELSSTTPSAANIEAYAEIVRDKGTLRKLIDVGTAMVNDGFMPDGRDSIELVCNAQMLIAGLLDSEPCDLESTVSIMQRVFDTLQTRYSRGERVQGLTTGLGDEFDEMINGLNPGVYVLAARPKMGKTTVAQGIAEHVAMTYRKPVAIFSLEMRSEKLGERMLASVGDVDATRLRTGQLDDDDWARVSEAMRKIRTADIYISRPRNVRVQHIVAQAKRQHAKKPLGLVVIDYLQLIQIEGDNRAAGIGEVSRSLVMLAHELSVPVLVLSQLNRDLEKRENKRPMPADLRDSGAIEQDADAVIFIYDDAVYNANSRWTGTAELIVALQRDGQTGMVRVRRRQDRFRFEPLPDGWEPDPLPPNPDKSPTKRQGFRRVDTRSQAAGGES